MSSRKSQKDRTEQSLGRGVNYLLKMKYGSNGADRDDMDPRVLETDPAVLHDAVRRIGIQDDAGLRQLDMFIEDDLFTTDWAGLLPDWYPTREHRLDALTAIEKGYLAWFKDSVAEPGRIVRDGYESEQPTLRISDDSRTYRICFLEADNWSLLVESWTGTDENDAEPEEWAHGMDAEDIGREIASSLDTELRFNSGNTSRRH
jgi:hypothetical protein